MTEKKWYEVEPTRYLAIGLAGAALMTGAGYLLKSCDTGSLQRVEHTYEIGSTAKKVELKRLETIERITQQCTQANNCKDVAAIIREIETKRELQEKK